METSDLHQETNRRLSHIAEKIEEGPRRADILALTQAVQYLGHVQFHALSFDHAESVVRGMNPDKMGDGFNMRDALDKFITAGLKATMAPPFDKQLRAAATVAAIKVEVAVDEAMQAEAAQEAVQEEQGDDQKV